jgi:DNA-binding MarR family transcriptional regulator
MTLSASHSESMLGTNWIEESNFLGTHAELHRRFPRIVIETKRHRKGGVQAKTNSPTRAKEMDLSLEHCLKSLGISLLSELDVLVFVHRRKTSLTSVKQIASLIGHDQAAVRIALGRLEREQLIAPSIASQGLRFYRILPQGDGGRQQCFRHLVNLSATRAGRLQLTKHLRPNGRNRGEKTLTLEQEGKWLCLKAI